MSPAHDFLADLKPNRNHVRKLAIQRFREAPEDVAALVEILPGDGIALEGRGGFTDVAAARAALGREAAGAGRQLYLVHRPPGRDYARPSRHDESLEVEWVDGDGIPGSATLL
ncbi:MAG: hypothetical protein M3320_00165 [Actinomycetota bacterium]|nr:hypothetical protein [Actinomycetota bacterium]MDQ5807070.1 hypothetical protein [Actinomycetota bacterium]